MKLYLVTLLICILCSCIIRKDYDDWSMFQHDSQHTGYSSSHMPESLNLLWINDTSVEICQYLSISKEKLFVSGYLSVFALDIDTGFEIIPYIFKQGISFPAVENNKMYLNTNGRIYCFDIDTGEELWHHFQPFLRFYSFPIVVNEYVFVGGGYPLLHIDENPETNKDLERAKRDAYKILCLDAQTGKTIWSFHARNWTIYSPAYFDGKVFVNDGGRGIYCLDAQTGECLWEKNIEWTSSSSLSLDGKRIFVRTYDGIICLDIETGENLWEYNCKGTVFRTPTVAYNRVFGSENKILFCLDAQTGKVLWKMEVDSPISTPIIAADEKAVFGTARAFLYIVHVESGKVCDSIDLHYETEDYKNEITTLALSDGKLVVGQGGGRITCFDGSGSRGIPIGVFAIAGISILFFSLTLITKMRNQRKK